MRHSLRYAIGSDAGISGRLNQDSVYASPHLLAVADGMGGHAHGEVASAVAVGVLAELDTRLPTADPLAALADTVAVVLRRLTDLAADDPELTGMGSTLTAMMFDGTRFGVAHVGDSRAYLVRDDTLSQLTRDHTLVQSLVDDGRITADEAAAHPRRSVLMRALQAGGAAEPDLFAHPTIEGDRYLLCSDGVTCVVDPDAIHAAMTTIHEPADVVNHLIDTAKRLRSPDNISCVVADVVRYKRSRWTRLRQPRGVSNPTIGSP
ncbi:MAG TPA: protein phosphatase 2C domain-containing protein [Pseudonocardiaceae bacterium]|nr:protein phosphatase 2C domain-containing protein [Pseudonocardiaceae bacterium]